MLRFRYYLAFSFLFISGTYLAIPAYYHVPFVKAPGPLMDANIYRAYQQSINKDKPSVVLIGDSTLDHGVDETYLSNLTNKSVYKLARHGSASAAWYLLVKNNIINARHKPEQVVIFFRGTMLTTPEFRTTGTYQVLLDELAKPDDQLLIDLAYISQMNWLEKKLDSYFPLYAHRQLVRTTLERVIKYPFLESALNLNGTEVDEAVNKVFGDSQIAQLNAIINAVDSYLYQPEKLDFEAQLPRSFLPEIIRLCKENDIQLILVRIKVQEFPTLESQPVGMHEYVNSLEQYLSQNDVIFLDFGTDPRIDPGDFYDPLHMTEAGQKTFTEILAESLREVVP